MSTSRKQKLIKIKEENKENAIESLSSSSTIVIDSIKSENGNRSEIKDLFDVTTVLSSLSKLRSIVYKLPHEFLHEAARNSFLNDDVSMEGGSEFDASNVRHSKRLRASSVSLLNDENVATTKEKKVEQQKRSKAPDGWLQRTPIFIADGRCGKLPKFLDRKRHSFCYLCGEVDSQLTKCSNSKCTTSFHDMCARMRPDGDYTLVFMKRNRGLYCPRHHCTACFSDHNRVRCFNGALVRCSQCELAWHPNCIPGGCVPNAKSEIICPRHVVYPNGVALHTSHCADCQQPSKGEKLIRCDSCLRSLHEKCYREVLHATERPSLVDDASAAAEPIGRCNWCHQFDFVRYGQYCMGRLGSTKWYPCQVVPNAEYPRPTDANFGQVGFMVVKWLPYKNKVFYNLISHNRVLPMTEMDYFFVTKAEQSDIYEEWQLAQKHALMNNPENSVPKPDQIDKNFSNGERVRKITRCKYSSNDLRPAKHQLHTPDMCLCPANMPDRCGPSSTCINRALRIECPKLCESKGACGNRSLSNGNNCVNVEIKPYHGRYFGAVTLQAIPANGFVGEYVGEIITHDEKQRRIDSIARMKSIEAQYYIMDLDGHRAIDAMFYGNDMRYVNHSCQPNCRVQVISSEFDIHVVLVALRDINEGEELSFDYNMYSTSTGRDVPKCRCNSENCSGILSAAGQNGGDKIYSGKDTATKRKSTALNVLAPNSSTSSKKSKTTGKMSAK